MKEELNVMPTEEKRVLIVEDNMLNQQLLKRMLLKLDVNADVANSMESARVCLKNQDFDIVILDFNLPDGSGDTLAVEIKEGSTRTKVYILTADIFIEQKTELKQKIDGLLFKPIRLEAVQQMLEMNG